jgi:hypothetical protein
MPAWKNVAEGKTWEPKPYYPFGPKMLAGIGGRLPDTIASRSIPIGLQRKRRGDRSVSKFLHHRDPALIEPVRDALVAWATEPVVAALREADPEPAVGLSDRQDDVWRPLFSIADMAGGNWPDLARAAATELHAGDTESESFGALLLADIRDVLGDDDRIATADLAARLIRDGERGPWADWWGKDVESGSEAASKKVGHQIARKLKPYGIHPGQVWIAGKNERGYAMVDLVDAFDRYLRPSSDAENARTLDRRSEGPSGDPVHDPHTPADQAPSVLAFPTKVERERDTMGADPTVCPDCRRMLHQGGGHFQGCPRAEGS